ncbi:hypothetical protein ACIRD3_31990 [Kitasatospora sp. NPDC093550]|uniref:hypothetical protein n=1 Tax=Kitasatospora sp. NPDC093550 TaxID=3364089 RepID=UPI0037FF50F5
MVGLLALAVAGTAARAVPAGPLVLQRQFTAAAEEIGVPPGLPLAPAYQESRWESHQGAPSTTGNYGVLGLTQVDVAAENAVTPERADYFCGRNINGDGPDARTLVVGHDTYYPIRFNHRLAFLKATDVQATTT